MASKISLKQCKNKALSLATTVALAVSSSACTFDTSGTSYSDALAGNGATALNELIPDLPLPGFPRGTIGGQVYGDFDCNGAQDLALGDPDRQIGSVDYAGVVRIYYSPSASGTPPQNEERVIYEYMFAGDQVEASAFGLALAAGNFDGSGCDDLAIGAPGFHDYDHGAVYILSGWSGQGLSTTSFDFLPGPNNRDHLFGLSLTAADFDGDTFADLAVGIPRATIDGQPDAGAIAAFYGGPGGLNGTPEVWSQHTTGVKGDSEDYDLFGFSMTSGDFNGDGRDDLAIGVPGECHESGLLFGVAACGLGSRGGAVNVLHGSPNGLTAADAVVADQIISQDQDGVKGKTENGDGFGFAVAAGDFNADGYADMAIGAPGETIDGVEHAGAVNVLYGSSLGLVADEKNGKGRDDQLFDQDCGNALSCQGLPLSGTPEADDFFGAGLAAGDLNGDGADDLAIGVPLDNSASDDGGSVNVLYGSVNGLRFGGSEFMNQATMGVSESLDRSYFLGMGLAIAGEGTRGLAIRHSDGEACASIAHRPGQADQLRTCSDDGLPRFIIERRFSGSTVGLAPPNQWVLAVGLEAGPGMVVAGDPISIAWDAYQGTPATYDWVGLIPEGANNYDYRTYAYTGGASEGERTLLAPDQTGYYEARYLPNNGCTDIAATQPMTVVPGLELSTTPRVARSGEPLRLCWTTMRGQPFSGSDWIGLYERYADNQEYTSWNRADGFADGCVSMVAPEVDSRETFEFRYLIDNTFVDIATSASITVIPAVELTVEPGSVESQETIEACWDVTGGQPNDEDWIGLFDMQSGLTVNVAPTDGLAQGCVSLTAPLVNAVVPHQVRYQLGSDFMPAAIANVEVRCGPAGDSDGDGICDGDDPCPSFANSVPFDDTNLDGVPDECQCGDPNGTGVYESIDLLLAFNCLLEDVSASGVCSGVLQQGDTNNSGLFESADLFAIWSVVNGVRPGHELTCPVRPEGTPPISEPVLFKVPLLPDPMEPQEPAITRNYSDTQAPAATGQSRTDDPYVVIFYKEPDCNPPLLVFSIANVGGILAP